MTISNLKRFMNRMEDQTIIESIEQFLEGKLAGEELKAFNLKMVNDPEFSQLVNDYRLAVKSVEVFGKSEMKKQLHKIHVEVASERILTKRNEWIRIAAVFLGLAAIGAFFLLNHLSGKTDNQQLFADNFTIYPDVLSERGQSPLQDILLEEAMSYYKKQDFENAAALFEKMEIENENFAEAVHFYKGISFLGTERVGEAKIIFSEIVNEPDRIFGDQAKWYLALLLLKMEEDSEAIDLLQEIVEKKTYNHLKASKILKKIR